MHITRTVRCDSGHVVLFDDETREICREIVRCNAFDRVFAATDYFDAGINRISAWVTGVRNVQKAMLYALLQPNDKLEKLQDSGSMTELMAYQGELKMLPFGDVWDLFCDENVLWWSHGGILHGESSERIAFLKNILEQLPKKCLAPYKSSWDDVCGISENADGIKCYIFYYSFMRPSFREYYFDDDTEYSVEVIDTWNMTTNNLGSFCGKFTVPLPSRQYMAVRITEKA